ncbi:acyloxyacyl hydrolase [Phenylobacterium sp.]|jgi:lipid A 3-O-deacylase|uniref:acyloxyacyl hydrolase n=1 Tax=Phenylobacterium sp. TaxID=1871053 RepID=UPI002E33922B|nr:acyloxyacyl hydrolase [Phenylobacterium sp.]HEX4712911.1 acyloxyacyl hydrolase [Phenylobacterium sp.]
MAGEIFAGGFQHAARLGIAAGDEESGADLELGYRTEPLSRRIIFGPRVYGLLSKNLNGDTNFASAGLLWRKNFTSRLYGQLGFGLAVHDGAVDLADAGTPRDRIAFGTRVLFQSELSLGWSLSRRWAVEASYVHISNGGIKANVNPGMDDVGARVVYRFGGR